MISIPRFFISQSYIKKIEEMDRDDKIKELINLLKEQAIEKRSKLIKEGVPLNDPRFSLKVTSDILEKAHDLGFNEFCGLRLYSE